MSRGWRPGVEAVVAVLVAVGASGCAGDDTTPQESVSTAVIAGTATTVPSVGPTTVAGDGPIAEGSGCEPEDGDLPDGRWFGTLVSISSDELELDLACWFIGEDAALAAEQDGEESPPPNDYYVRDAAADTVAVPLDPAATSLVHPDGSPQGVSGTVDDLIRAGEDRGGYPYAVWVEVRDRRAVSVQEQWVP